MKEVKVTIRVGSVGVGGISNGVHLPGIQRSTTMTLSAICDIDPERLRITGDKYSIPENRRFTDYRALIACPDVDAVDISTSNDAHFPIALAAAKAGKPYCLEKPVTLTYAEAAELYAQTVNRHVPNMVCFSYRFKPAARYARALIAAGELGRIHHVDIQYSQVWGLAALNAPLVWRFQRARSGSGTLGDLGSHALDLMRFVTGEELSRLTAQARTFLDRRRLPDGSGEGTVDVDDAVSVLADLSGGGTASMRATRYGHGRGNYQRMEVYGEKAALIYELDLEPNVDTLDVCAGSVMGQAHVFARLPIPQIYACDQMQSFADIVCGAGDGLAATIRDGAINQAALDAILESARSQQWVVPAAV